MSSQPLVPPSSTNSLAVGDAREATSDSPIIYSSFSVNLDLPHLFLILDVSRLPSARQSGKYCPTGDSFSSPCGGINTTISSSLCLVLLFILQTDHCLIFLSPSQFSNFGVEFASQIFVAPVTSSPQPSRYQRTVKADQFICANHSHQFVQLQPQTFFTSLYHRTLCLPR
jgi:hypothetical protein